jgi:hypothetical protein
MQPRACSDVQFRPPAQSLPVLRAACRDILVLPPVLALTHQRFRTSSSAPRPFAEISGSIASFSRLLPFPKTVPNLVCHFKGSLHFLPALCKRAVRSTALRMRRSCARPGRQLDGLGLSRFTNATSKLLKCSCCCALGAQRDSLSVPRAFSFVVSEEGRPFFQIWLRWMNSGSILQETANTSDPVRQRIFRKSRNRACTSAHEG